MSYNFQTIKNKVKPLTEYENVTQTVLFGNAVLATLMSGRIYKIIPQNGHCSRESSVRTLVFRKKVRQQFRITLYHTLASFPNAENVGTTTYARS
jgi:hypothetical protein